MEQLFSAGKAYLKINSLVKTPLHEFMAVERAGLWAPACAQLYALATMEDKRTWDSVEKPFLITIFGSALDSPLHPSTPL